VLTVEKSFNCVDGGKILLSVCDLSEVKPSECDLSEVKPFDMLQQNWALFDRIYSI
jgi:hypothetical protein